MRFQILLYKNKILLRHCLCLTYFQRTLILHYYNIVHIHYISSLGISLRIVPTTKTTHQTKVAANFPFDPTIEVEMLDGSGSRITTGPDSSLVSFFSFFLVFVLVSNLCCLKKPK